jgi:hypothetical protein
LLRLDVTCFVAVLLFFLGTGMLFTETLGFPADFCAGLEFLPEFLPAAFAAFGGCFFVAIK